MTDATRQRWIAFGLVTLVAFAIFLAALPSGITGGDAGELTVAAYFLGIPHPPGYPTWCLAAHPFTWIPYGSIAWRVALSSAVFGALACGVVALIVHAITRRWDVCLVTGLVLAYSAPFYSQATIAEVYALNALCFSLCAYLLLRWQHVRDWRYLYGVALLCGLGQGVHNTMTLLTPVFALYVFAQNPGILWEGRRVLLCVALFLLGCCTFLYLPIRSLANPPIDWGNPETWDNFRAVVSREQFDFMYGQFPRGVLHFCAQLKDMFLASLSAADDIMQFLLALCSLFGIIVYLFSSAWVLPVLASLGLLVSWRKDLRTTVLFAATALLPVLVITWVQNPLGTAEWDEVMVPFQIPLVWELVIAAGCWIGRNPDNSSERFRKATVVFGLIGLLGLVSLAFVEGPPEEDRWVASYTGNILKTLPPNAIFFAGPDHAAFPILYRQTVEHERPDVTIGNPYGYVDVSLIADAPKELLQALGPRPTRGREAEYFSWLLTHTQRPVFFSERPTLEPDAPVQFRQEGLLYRALTHPGELDTTPVWPADYHWPEEESVMRDDFLTGYVTRQIAAEVNLKHLAVEFATDSPFPGRIANLRSLIARDPEYLNNLGVLLARSHREQDAKELFEEALACDPGNETVRRNLERLKARP